MLTSKVPVRDNSSLKLDEILCDNLAGEQKLKQVMRVTYLQLYIDIER